VPSSLIFGDTARALSTTPALVYLRVQPRRLSHLPRTVTTKRRAGAKSKKHDAPASAEDRPPLGTADRPESPEVPRTTARAPRGKAKRAADTEDDSTGTLRTARGRRTPTSTAAGAASNRLATAGKGRAVAALASSAKSSTARTVGEKENTPERIHVKEEEDEKLPLPQVAGRGSRARKGATVCRSCSLQGDMCIMSPVFFVLYSNYYT
jgi:hypothetical protein